MSAIVMGAVFKTLEIGGFDKLVLLKLVNHCEHDGSNAYPSQPTIARECGITVRTVRTSLKRLLSAGFIEVVKPATNTRQAHYRVVVERLGSRPAGPSGPEANGVHPCEVRPAGPSGLEANHVHPHDVRAAGPAGPDRQATSSRPEGPASDPSITVIQTSHALGPAQAGPSASVFSKSLTGFGKLWALYPRKEARAAARAEYAALTMTPELHARIVDALRAQLASGQLEVHGARYVPLLANWLADERWTDGIQEMRRRGNKTASAVPMDSLVMTA